MDRISQLPECIVYHVLSSINAFHAPPVELVRMSVLSKNWFDLIASFPNLDFNLYTFKKVSRKCFFKYVEYATTRFCHQNVSAQSFKLITSIRDPSELNTVNRCLELVLKNGLTELEIDIVTLSNVPKYRLPNILLSVSLLKSLTVIGCELPSSFVLYASKFKSLIRLKLQKVGINDESIKYLTTSCPLLQIFCIKNCIGFKSFCVYGHQHLQAVKICFDTPVERIDIEAPNLSNLKVQDIFELGAPQMNLASCKKLASVTYNGHPSPNSNGFTDLLSNFPFIENLNLTTNYECNKLKLSSHTLRTLVLHSNWNLEDIGLSTPNLGLFVYSCNYRLWPIVMDKRRPFLRDSTSLKACMQCYPGSYIDILWFRNLRQFLDKENGFKVLNLYVHAIYSQKFKVLEKLKANELSPYELEHVELQLDTHKESSSHIAIVDAVLWCCRPRSLTLRSSFPFNDFEDVVKFTCQKLLQQEDENTNIQIVSSSSSKAQKYLRYFKSMSMTLPCKGESVNFIKEEGTPFYQIIL